MSHVQKVEMALHTGTIVGLSGIAYQLGDITPIEELPLLANNPDLIAHYTQQGYENFAQSTLTFSSQAVHAARQTLQKTGLTAGDIDAVVIGTSELRDCDEYPESITVRILKELGINNVCFVGVTFAGCANLSSSIKVARNLVAVDGYRKVLVIETNQVRGNLERVGRKQDMNLLSKIFSDGAVSCIVTADPGDFTVLGMDQLVSYNPEDTPSPAARMAKNFAAYRRVIDRALAQADVSQDQIHCILFNNFNFMMLLNIRKALGFSHSKFYFTNLGRHAHVWSADTLINLHDYCAEKTPPAGSLFILIANGLSYYSAIVCRKN